MTEPIEQQVLEILKDVLTTKKGSRANRGRAKWLSASTPENPDLRECQDCKVVKPLSEFDLAGRYHRTFCKTCRNKRWKAYRKEMAFNQRERTLDMMAVYAFVFKHGSRLHAADVKAQREKQGGSCPLCQEPLGRGKGNKGQQVEHDHETLQPRGLTCKSCNRNIGNFEAVLAMSPEYRERLEAYLANPPWVLPPVDSAAVRRRLESRRYKGYKPMRLVSSVVTVEASTDR